MRIVVVGDVVVDHHVYEGERNSPAATQARGVRVVREPGGAHALYRLIAALPASASRRRLAAQAQTDRQFEQAVQDFQKNLTDRTPQHVELPVSPEEELQVQFGLSLPEVHANPCGHHALAVFKPYPKHASHSDPIEAQKKVWRAEVLLGYGHDDPAAMDADPSSPSCDSFRPAPSLEDCGEILILDDAGFMFRNDRDCWKLPSSEAELPKWIVLKMSRPVCRGELWSALQPYRDRLIVVVSAAELRHETAGISAGLSWERTVEDLVEALDSDPMLRQLSDCRHLLVNFSADGALWVDFGSKVEGKAGPTEPKCRLVYDAASIEGQWAEQTQGEVFGFMSCLVAAMTVEFVRNSEHPETSPNLAAALATGLATMRDLRQLGHGEVGDRHPTGYPVERLAAVLVASPRGFSQCDVPWNYLLHTASGNRLPWSIAIQSQIAPSGEMLPLPMMGLAHQVVQRGRRMLNHLPHAQFGGLFTIDRGEIETLRTLRRLMQQYKQSCSISGAVGKPLSLGVFGPPGAGKSFGVKQIAKEIFGASAWLEFNLSQFGDRDLQGALHQVRDKVLEVGIPVVFWDEFDSQKYHWLQYLLAPMQDGKFQEGQISHPIGHCVFIFAGATSHTFQQFGPARPSPHSAPDIHKAWTEYVLAKGPDFLSRLDGYYNVLGPNQRTLVTTSGEAINDPTDTCSPVRRALLLRQFICGSNKHRLAIDPGLLRALLEVPAYRNGARSLEKLATSLRPKGPASTVRRSALGSPEQLAMFVDFPIASKVTEKPSSTVATLTPAEVYRHFLALCRADESYQQSDVTELLAAAIQGFYQQFASQPGMTIQEINNREYARLSEDSKNSNRAAARRMAEVLSIAGLRLIRQEDGLALPATHDRSIAAHLELHLENMAELEHDLWCEERQSQGWRFGTPRHDARKFHPLIVPYMDLPENEKDKDRNQIRSYPAIAHSTGLKIIFR